MAIEEPNPSGAARPKTQEHGIVTYIHDVKPLRRDSKGNIQSGDVEPEYTKSNTKILGLGNIDDVGYQVMLLDQELYDLYDGIRKRGMDFKEKKTAEGVQDTIINRMHTSLKLSNSIDGFAQKNIVTNINISEQEQRIGEIRNESWPSKIYHKVRGK